MSRRAQPGRDNGVPGPEREQGIDGVFRNLDYFLVVERFRDALQVPLTVKVSVG